MRFSRRIFLLPAALLILAAPVFLLAAQESARQEDKSIVLLVEALRKGAREQAGMGRAGQAVAEKFWRKGAATIPYLLPLLQDESEGVRGLAAYILRDIKGLTEKDLDPLIEACRASRDGGWIPPAIAHVGTPRAVKFLVEETVRKRHSQSQFDAAIESLGEKAIPDMVRVYQEDQTWDTDLENTMFHLFKDLGAQAVSAVEPLMKIAGDPALPAARRIAALHAVGAIGLPARGAVPVLMKLRKDDGSEEVRNTATAAILNIGTGEAAPILVKTLEESNDWNEKANCIMNIAGLKERGKSAGPALMKCLQGDWTVRDYAVRAMGYIGYSDAADEMIRLLSCEDDWLAVWCAAGALGRLRSERALPALDRVAKSHWFPAVRKQAADAAREIRTGKAAGPAEIEGAFRQNFLVFEYAGGQVEPLLEEDLKWIKSRVPDTQITGPILVKGGPGTLKQIEGHGIKVEEGNLLGYDRGEFGGGLEICDEKGNILKDLPLGNTHAIYKTEKGIFAVVGVSNGFIYKIGRGPDGEWAVREWLVLPGGPSLTVMLKNGDFLISCYNGLVTVTQEGVVKFHLREDVVGKGGKF